MEDCSGLPRMSRGHYSLSVALGLLLVDKIKAFRLQQHYQQMNSIVCLVLPQQSDR
jgi:hypothetical protein